MLKESMPPMPAIPAIARRGRRRSALALALAWVAVSAAAGPAGAGELRVILEGETAVSNDGNYNQTAGLDGQDETVGRASAALRLSYELQRSSLALIYSPSYEQAFGNSGSDSGLSGIAHRLLFGFDGSLTRRLGLHVQERLVSSPSLDFYLPVIAPETAAVTRRGDQLTHDLDVSLVQELTRRSSLQLGATHSLWTFESTSLFDTESLTARLGAAFNLTADRQIDASAARGRFEYEDGTESDVQTWGLGLSLGLGRSSQLRIEGGMFSVETDVPPLIVPAEPGEPVPGPAPVGEPFLGTESHDGWRGGIQFSQRRDLFHWSAGYSHDISAGFGLGRAAVTDNAFLGISTEIGRRLTLGLDGSGSLQRELSDRAELGGGTGEGETLTDFVAGTLRFGWTFAPSVRLTGGYSRIWQQAEAEPFEDLSFARYFLGLSFRLFSTGETPKDPVPQGRETGEETDEKPDAQ